MKRFVFGACVLLTSETPAFARGSRRFEPTDLDLTPVGVVEIDTQFGTIGGNQPRSIAPDVEASLGVAENCELEVDTTYGVEGGKARFLDQTWVSVRLGIVDARNDTKNQGFSAGVQVGPKVPTGIGSRGFGFEGLMVAGGVTGPLHAYANLGVIVDSYDTTAESSKRPTGIEAGIDFQYDLDAVDRWSLTSEVGLIQFFSVSPNQLQITAGTAYRVIPELELSVVGLAGIYGDDRWGLLFGVAPRFKAF